MSKHSYPVGNTIAAAFCIVLLVTFAFPQGSNVGSIGGGKQSGGRRSAPAACRPTVISKPPVYVDSTVSSLTVATEPGAKVVLVPVVKSKALVTRTEIADTDGKAFFDNVAVVANESKYTVTSSKDNFTPLTDEVSIQKKKSAAISIRIKEVTYELTVPTNLKRGEVRFTRLANAGERQKIKYTVVAIDQNGKASLDSLTKGDYIVGVSPTEDPEFEPKNVPLKIPVTDEVQASGSFGKMFELDRKVSSEIFGAGWSQDEWTLPSGWSVEGGKMMKVRNTEGVALPTNPRYLYYLGFEMTAEVKLKDDGVAGFALLARDTRNYYLLTISGAKGTDPNTAAIYPVKDNVRGSALVVAPLGPLAPTVNRDKGFRLTVRAENYKFTVSIDDPTEGTVPVTNPADAFKLYQKGAVGIVGLPKSNFEVSYLEVRHL
jgi:hypothetical protein